MAADLFTYGLPAQRPSLLLASSFYAFFHDNYAPNDYSLLNKNRVLTHTLYKYASTILTIEISDPRYSKP